MPSVPEGALMEDRKQENARLAPAPEEEVEHSRACLAAKQSLRERTFDIIREPLLQDGSMPSLRDVGFADFTETIIRLHKSGDSKSLVQLSDLWLAHSHTGSCWSDVALDLAETHWNLFKADFYSLRVCQGFKHLLAAQAALQHHCPDHEMLAEVSEAVDDNTPKYIEFALQSSNTDQRQEVLDFFKTNLCASEGPLGTSFPEERAAILKQLRQFITTEELRNLYADRRTEAAVAALRGDAAYDEALYLLANAVSSADPGLLEVAKKHFNRLHQRMNVTKELAVCYTLSGDLQSAVNTLRLGPSEWFVAPPHPQVLEFVTSAGGGSTPEAIDVGVRALVQQWVQNELSLQMKGFGRTFTLENWEALPQVRQYIQQQVPPLPVPVSTQAPAPAPAPARAPAPVSPPRPVAAPEEVSEAVATERTAMGMRGTLSSMMAKILDLFGLDTLAAKLREGLALPPEQEPSGAAESTTAGSSVLVRLLKRIAGAVAIIAMFGVGTVLMIRAAATFKPQAAMSCPQPVLNVHSTDVSTADINAISQSLRQWIQAKSRAMGPDHDVESLEAVLRGPMLREWRKRARDLKEQDTHWNYQVSNIVIRRAEMVRSGVALVVVDLAEKAGAVFRSKQLDGYNQEVTVEYRLVCRGDVWQIANARRINPASV